ncbi:rh95 [macacine betaherpesvirus 3]|uniref:Rh95 n=1 Tax=Rhesus cytomegalovirus (strain 68-1) TaxID=47929 RepID=Q2FAM1_RHCM6|nr:rh95 [macacine betaherpesvirus 3]
MALVASSSRAAANRNRFGDRWSRHPGTGGFSAASGSCSAAACPDPALRPGLVGASRLPTRRRSARAARTTWSRNRGRPSAAVRAPQGAYPANPGTAQLAGGGVARPSWGAGARFPGRSQASVPPSRAHAPPPARAARPLPGERAWPRPQRAAQKGGGARPRSPIPQDPARGGVGLSRGRGRRMQDAVPSPRPGEQGRVCRGEGVAPAERRPIPQAARGEVGGRGGGRGSEVYF